jgi:hypothetical protein
MVSPEKLAANRSNAQKSTGPQSEKGKRQSRLNATKHGLSIPIGSDVAVRSEVDRLAALIAGEAADYESFELAWSVAATEFDLRRVRVARLLALEDAVEGEKRVAPIGPGNARPDVRDANFNYNEMLQRIDALARLERYHRRALSRRHKAIRALLIKAAGS